MTPADIANIKLADVVCVYSGTPDSSGNHCRCGCRGNYRYNPSHPGIVAGADPGRGYPLGAEEISRIGVSRIFNTVQQHVAQGGAFTFNNVNADEHYVDIELVTGRCYTIYFKPAQEN